MKRILYQPWGGLGDNLQYSTLPELYHEKGDEFYIHDHNAYRNPEIYKLVWELNPYVKGISNEQYNVGECMNYNRFNFNESIVYNQEKTHGFEPKNRTPKIFYTPKNILEFNNKIFMDMSTISSNPIVVQNLKEILSFDFSNYEIIHPKFKNLISNNHKVMENQENANMVEIESIFHYCDIINSCYYFICGFSGQSVLASAINKTNTICISSFGKNHDYCFSNINYHFI